jgi:hypothetical protein
MKQTAVEWLVNKIASKIDNEYWSNQQDITEYIEQAKAMEKEQIINAWIVADNPLQRMEAEKYYNITYKQD